MAPLRASNSCTSATTVAPVANVKASSSLFRLTYQLGIEFEFTPGGITSFDNMSGLLIRLWGELCSVMSLVGVWEIIQLSKISSVPPSLSFAVATSSGD